MSWLRSGWLDARNLRFRRIHCPKPAIITEVISAATGGVANVVVVIRAP